jgi:hypothetical protein
MEDAERCLDHANSPKILARMLSRLRLLIQYGADIKTHGVSEIIRKGYALRVPAEAAEFETFLNGRAFGIGSPSKVKRFAFWQRRS